MKAFTQWCLRHHQRLGLWAWLFIACWALSGLAHPILSRINPTAQATGTLLQPQAEHHIEPQAIASALGPFTHLRVFNHQQRLLLQLDHTRFADAATLAPLANFEQNYAVDLARHFAGEPEATVAAITKISAFDDDYLTINRLLPVWRVEFARDDNLRVYVDTQQGQLATLVDDTKAATGHWFRTLHSWHFWPHEPSRVWLMSAALLLITALGLMGFWLYLRWWRQGVFNHQHRWARSRRWHAHLSGVLALALTCFCTSGLFHLWASNPHPALGQALENDAPPFGITLPGGWLEAQWIASGQQQHWRVVSAPEQGLDPHTSAHKQTLESPQKSGHQHHNPKARPVMPVIQYVGAERMASAPDSNFTDTAQALARAQSRHWRGELAVKSTEYMAHFNRHYGFINKRLPVVAVRTQDDRGAQGPTYFIQPHTGTLAAVSNTTSALEGASFGYLHKWHHLDFLGRNLRDLLLALTVLGIFSAACLGLWRWRQKPRAQAANPTRAKASVVCE
ncbi:PepSY domain-containing protein [Simiduia sp. 21SJ11W-1]|uniref:PepSY-associated TM helix domain-containing protein n=1 Tax=Simiduia sp. 21SJ11W-1 TaxID=2909669 RepID=UPI0020A1F626|nr:PepSY-associated TM helix domain-containing protein [Simiduia sp. 21SJ11W-1]UTA49023.1 PepSY domain-containing protein [Simiduia sp. 21SJ11W-1]